ncbi:MAG: hypothetical protein FJ145_16385 [Deltaproteobacteria bacterium]|nr:hypothetical protein [Deltaproteobacteria bacterium]
MGTTVIAWHEFFAALGRQPAAALSEWLSAWRFGEEGVSLRVEFAKQLPAYEDATPAAAPACSEKLH